MSANPSPIPVLSVDADPFLRQKRREIARFVGTSWLDTI
jgi:hypothetical protein